MKTLGLVVLLAVGVGEARAQGGVPPLGLDGIFLAGLAIDAVILVGGGVTGAGSSWTVSKGRVNKHWFAASFSLATLNFGVAALWAYLGGEAFSTYNPGALAAFCTLMGVSHVAVGLWNVIMPSFALTRDSTDPTGPSVAPVVLTGRTMAGGRWSGLGVQVTNF